MNIRYLVNCTITYHYHRNNSVGLFDITSRLRQIIFDFLQGIFLKNCIDKHISLKSYMSKCQRMLRDIFLAINLTDIKQFCPMEHFEN